MVVGTKSAAGAEDHLKCYGGYRFYIGHKGFVIATRVDWGLPDLLWWL